MLDTFFLSPQIFFESMGVDNFAGSPHYQPPKIMLSRESLYFGKFFPQRCKLIAMFSSFLSDRKLKWVFLNLKFSSYEVMGCLLLTMA